MTDPLRELAALYAEMEAAYDRTAQTAGFSCAGCPDNCCDSYFLHHTYLEWAFLWEGFRQLPVETRKAVRRRAMAYAVACEQELARGGRPRRPCPLLDEQGLCALYGSRLMICRLHGVPATQTQPDGGVKTFAGCFRFQERGGDQTSVPPLDRTTFLQRLASLEAAFLGSRRGLLPRQSQTIADMLVKGEPPLADE